MGDVYLKEDAVALLKDKYVLFLGDSNVRALYKDLVWLCKSNTLIDVRILKRRLELSYLGDKLLERSELTCGRDFSEHRLFEYKNIKIEFLFVTRCYSTKIEKIFLDIKNGKRKPPDVIYMNSCLWDVCRWGPNGVRDYKTNMTKLMKLVKSVLPAKTLFIWGTALPTASTTSGGLIIKQIEFLQAGLRIHVIEANKFTSALVSSYGFDVLDFHHYMHYQITRRSADGIHFLPPAVRFLINIFLTHIALSWDVKLPEHLKENTFPLENQIKCAINTSPKKVDKIVHEMDIIANNLSFAVNKAPTPKKKKRKNKKNKRIVTKIVNNNIAQVSKNPETPLNQEASQAVKEPQETKPQDNTVFSETPRDHRLLTFDSFSPGVDIQKCYESCESFNSQFSQDNYHRENYSSTNRFNHYHNMNRGYNRQSNVCNVYNDPYNLVSQLSYNLASQLNYNLASQLNYLQGNYQLTYNNYQNTYVQPTYYNPYPAAPAAATSNARPYYGNNKMNDERRYHGGYRNNYENHGFGPVRPKPNVVGNRYWAPY